MLGDLTGAIFNAKLKGGEISARRDLQIEYVKRLIDIAVTEAKPAKFDHLSVAAAWGQLQSIRELTGKSVANLDPATLNHRRYLAWRIEKALENAGK